MPKNQQITQNTKVGSENKNQVTLRAAFDIEVSLVSHDKLDQILEYTNDTPTFGLIVTCFSFGLGCILALFTCSINNEYIFGGILAGAAVCFSVGINKYSVHRTERLRIRRMVQKIKMHRCMLE